MQVKNSGQMDAPLFAQHMVSVTLTFFRPNSAAAADLAKLGGLNALVQADRDWAVRGLVAELHPELCPLR